MLGNELKITVKCYFFLSGSYIQLEIPEHIKSANARSPASRVSVCLSD